MSTKALFITSLGGDKLPIGPVTEFVRSSGNILTATGHGLDTGAGPFKVMNNVADPPSGLVESVRASTFLTATNPIATDVVVVDGKTYTYIATPAADGDVDVGSADAAGTTKSIMNLAAAINQDVLAAAGTYDLDTVLLPAVRAVLTDVDIVKFVAKTLDATIGNAITVASPDGTLVVDNGTLENGADGTDYFFIRLTDDTFSLATSKVNALAGTEQALADAGTGITTLVRTVETLANALEDVVLNVLTATGARTLDKTFNVAKFWRGAIDGLHSDRT